MPWELWPQRTQSTRRTPADKAPQRAAAPPLSSPCATASRPPHPWQRRRCAGWYTRAFRVGAALWVPPRRARCRHPSRTPAPLACGKPAVAPCPRHPTPARVVATAAVAAPAPSAPAPPDAAATD
eukprot:3881001-Prymnesium_polylepis.2